MSVIGALASEAEALPGRRDVARLVEEGAPLARVPVPALLAAIKDADPESLPAHLEGTTREQRQALLDIDAWRKDDVDMGSLHFWTRAHLGAKEALRREFSRSPSFALFLKGALALSTFDMEDPAYPDHDDHFLTEDGALLVEHGPMDPGLADAARALIGELYADMGVERAYARLFKVVSDTWSNMVEEELRARNGRLADMGLMDHQEALELVSPAPLPVLLARATGTAAPPAPGAPRVPPPSAGAVAAFRGEAGPLERELAKAADAGRAAFLTADLARLVNGALVLDGALGAGDEACRASARKARDAVLLGLDHVAREAGDALKGPLLGRLAPSDLHRHGTGLLRRRRAAVARALAASPFGDDASFLGPAWSAFLEGSLADPPRFAPGPGLAAAPVTTAAAWDAWGRRADLFARVLPLAEALARRLDGLKARGLLADRFYLNHDVDDIDLESILVSSLAAFALSAADAPPARKLGLTPSEFRRALPVLTDGGAAGGRLVRDFLGSLGLGDVQGLDEHIGELVRDHLGGLPPGPLSDRDLRHVGGAVILDDGCCG